MCRFPDFRTVVFTWFRLCCVANTKRNSLVSRPNNVDVIFSAIFRMQAGSPDGGTTLLECCVDLVGVSRNVRCLPAIVRLREEFVIGGGGMKVRCSTRLRKYMETKNHFVKVVCSAVFRLRGGGLQ